MSHKVGFISLGCPKALVDSERIVTQLRAEGYEIVDQYDESEVVIINTCGFIEDAIAESMDAIDEALHENGKVIVTGCLGAKGNTVKENFPNVLAVTGPHAADEVMQAVHKQCPPDENPFTQLVPPAGIKLTPKHYSYIKISEGCNHRCTFCIIPDLRGDLDSRPVNNVLDEAKALVETGVKELLVISQDTSAYGVDVKYRTEFWNGTPVKTRFYDLAKELGKLGVWVRLHYVYPYPHVDDIIPLMADGLILPYLDIPFQHASPAVLKAMKRPASNEKVLERIFKWREACPDLTIRSTFITGFPGETDRDFEQLLDFIKEAKLDRVGCFTYSAVEGAKANELANPIPDAVKEERQAIFMETQAAISAAKLEDKIGRTEDVIIDEINEQDGIIGRTKGDAPEIDGMVFISSEAQYQPGDIIQVKITHASEHDLYGTAV